MRLWWGTAHWCCSPDSQVRTPSPPCSAWSQGFRGNRMKVNQLMAPVAIQGFPCLSHQYAPAVCTEKESPLGTPDRLFPASSSQNFCASYWVPGKGPKCLRWSLPHTSAKLSTLWHRPWGSPAEFFPALVTTCSHGTREDPECVEEASQAGGRSSPSFPLKNICWCLFHHEAEARCMWTRDWNIWTPTPILQMRKQRQVF